MAATMAAAPRGSINITGTPWSMEHELGACILYYIIYYIIFRQNSSDDVILLYDVRGASI